MNPVIQLFVESYADKFTTISMEEICLSARENLLLLENLFYISLAFLFFLLLFYIFHFRLKKPVLARRIIIIFIMIIMGVGWPMTLYYGLRNNITPAVLLLGCFTLLVQNVYLLFLYWVDPFSPSTPWKYGYKVCTWILLALQSLNLFSIISAGLAQGVVMAQAWGAKLLADQMMATAESLSLDLEDGKISDPSAKDSTLFLPYPEERKINPLAKAGDWFGLRGKLIDAKVEDMVNQPSQDKTLRFQHEAAAATTGRRGAGDLYNLDDLKKLGVEPGNSIESTHRVRGKTESMEKAQDIYISCTAKSDIKQGIENYNQEKSFFKRTLLNHGAHLAIPHKAGCLAYTAHPEGGFTALRGTLSLQVGAHGRLTTLPSLKTEHYTPESPLASQNSPSVGLKAFQDSFK